MDAAFPHSARYGTRDRCYTGRLVAEKLGGMHSPGGDEKLHGHNGYHRGDSVWLYVPFLNCARLRGGAYSERVFYMQIGRLPGLGMNQQQNQYFQNANRVLDARAAQLQEKRGDAARTDTAVFNYKPQRAQGNSMLQSLMEQKESLMERKRSLMKEAKTGGGSVKEQMDQINEQLEQLEEQISQQMLAEATRMDKNDVKKKEEEAPKTEEEIEAERAGELTKMSADLSTAQVVASVQRKVASEARILQSEMAQDSMAGADGATMAELDDIIETLRAREAAAAGNVEAPKADVPKPDAPKLETVPAKAPAPMAEAPKTPAARYAETPEAAATQTSETAEDAEQPAQMGRIQGARATLSNSSPLAKSTSKPRELAELEGKAAQLAGMVGGKLREITEEDDGEAPVEKTDAEETGEAAE